MIKRINSQHRLIARHILRGKSQREIAQKLEMSESHLCRVVKSPLFRQLMIDMQNHADQETFEAIEYFKGYAKEAAETITNILNDENEGAHYRNQTTDT